MNTDLFTKVSEARHEGVFLRLTVEFRNREYTLVEMDANNRVLAPSMQYYDISVVITNLNLNNGMALKN